MSKGRITGLMNREAAAPEIPRRGSFFVSQPAQLYFFKYPDDTGNSK